MGQHEKFRRPRVLLVEDDGPSQKLVRLILEKQYEVIAVDDGFGALAAYDSGKFDLILLDLMMPKMDGFETARRIRGLERQGGREPVPIMAITAMVTNETRRKCLDYEINDFISKPVDIDEVYAIVRKHIH